MIRSDNKNTANKFRYVLESNLVGVLKLHLLSNIKIPNYFNYERRFNGVFSRKNLPRIKDEAYLTNLDDKNSKETHWVSLVIERNTAAYFDSFGVEYIQYEVLNKIKDKLLTIYLQHKIMNLLYVDFLMLLSQNICLQGKLC